MVRIIVGIIYPNNIECQGGRSYTLRIRIVLFVLLDVLIFVHYRIDVVNQRLPEDGHVFIFVIQFFLVIVRRGKSLPGESVDEQRMLLQVLFQRILFRYDTGIVVVIYVVLEVVIGVRVGDAIVGLVLSVFHVIKLLVGEIV